MSRSAYQKFMEVKLGSNRPKKISNLFGFVGTALPQCKRKVTPIFPTNDRNGDLHWH
jgi:hypothetical protein